MYPRVKSVVAREDYELEIIFTNGEVKTHDCSSFPYEGGVFQEFQNVEYFKHARVEGGTVVWPPEKNICPDALYEDSHR